jgi:hypothetical protein
MDKIKEKFAKKALPLAEEIKQFIKENYVKEDDKSEKES